MLYIIEYIVASTRFTASFSSFSSTQFWQMGGMIVIYLSDFFKKSPPARGSSVLKEAQVCGLCSYNPLPGFCFCLTTCRHRSWIVGWELAENCDAFLFSHSEPGLLCKASLVLQSLSGPYAVEGGPRGEWEWTQLIRRCKRNVCDVLWGLSSE